MAVAGLFNAKGEMPFFTDAVSAATGVAFVARGLPVLHKIHYTGTMLLADVLYNRLPSLSRLRGDLAFSLPSTQHMLFGTFFYAALCAGDLDLSCFRPLQGKVSWSFVRHSGMIAVEPINTAYWEAPVVAFWAVKRGQLAPVGGGWLVHDAILTAGHVNDAMLVLKAQGAEIFVGRCERVVCNVNNLYRFEPELVARPSERDLKRNPVTGDFALVRPPKQLAQLSLRVGRVGFSPATSCRVGSGFYKLVAGQWIFHRTFGVCQFGTPEFGGQSHPGACFWSGESVPSASGFPLLSDTKELVGLNIGALEQGDRSTAVAVRAGAVFRYFISRKKTYFEKGRFGRVTQVPKPKSTPMPEPAFSKHSRMTTTSNGTPRLRRVRVTLMLGILMKKGSFLRLMLLMRKMRLKRDVRPTCVLENQRAGQNESTS